MTKPQNKKPTFEEKIDTINDAIRKRRKSWYLHAVKDLDYDDVSQKLRIHIWVKWHLWNPEIGPLEPWLNKTITNHTRNIMRDNYYNFAKPCSHCPAAQDNSVTGESNGCRIYGSQNAECKLYSKWLKNKQHAFNVKIALPLHNHVRDVNYDNVCNDSIDYETAKQNLHDKIIPKLTKTQKKVYILLFVEEKEEEEVAQIMGYKASKTGKNKHRYKQISNYIKKFKEISKKIMEQNDIFYE